MDSKKCKKIPPKKGKTKSNQPTGNTNSKTTPTATATNYDSKVKKTTSYFSYVQPHIPYSNGTNLYCIILTKLKLYICTQLLSIYSLIH